MPLYEMVLLLNAKASLPVVANVMRRMASSVWAAKGVVRRLDNMGIMPLAYPMYHHGDKHFKARWMVFLFDGNTKCLKNVHESIKQEENIFRWGLYRQKDDFRDKYDELFYHAGYARGTTQEPMRELLNKQFSHLQYRNVRDAFTQAIYPQKFDEQDEVSPQRDASEEEINRLIEKAKATRKKTKDTEAKNIFEMFDFEEYFENRGQEPTQSKVEETKQPKSSEAKSQEPKSQEPKTQEPKSEETKSQEPKTQEPKSEETKSQEPKTQEPKSEESKSEEDVSARIESFEKNLKELEKSAEKVKKEFKDLGFD